MRAQSVVNANDKELDLCYTDLLYEDDLREYYRLRDSFKRELSNSKRGESIENFSKKINRIRSFVIKNDSNDWKRSFAAGIIFLPDSIAINIKQLILLLGKCKSSINGSFHQLGYISRPISSETDELLLSSISYLTKSKRELKKWTIRQKKNYMSVDVKNIGNKYGKTVYETPFINNGSYISCINGVNYYNYVGDRRKQDEIVNISGYGENHMWKGTASFLPCPLKFRNKMYLQRFDKALEFGATGWYKNVRL